MTRQMRHRGFTLAEILVVVGVIAVLIAVLFPALIRAGRVAKKSESMNRLRQINIWMGEYSGDNNDYIIPSQFDYSDDNVFSYQGKVRTVPDSEPGKTLSVGGEHVGTWSDIIWTVNELAGSAADLKTIEAADSVSYRFDSPDKRVYEALGGDLRNPLRSAALNTRNFEYSNSDGIFKPFGEGARERNLPGFFAANDFFNARPDAPAIAGAPSPPAIGNWFTNGRIRVPDRAMYLVDSYAGEVIAPVAEPYDNPDVGADGATVIPDAADRTGEVDFRYNGSCLMLFLDGHIEDPGPWPDLSYLQEVVRVNVTNPLSSTPASP